MRFSLLRYLAAAGSLMIGSAFAQDTAVTVQGFCIDKDGTKCLEVALPGATVAYNRLPKSPDGKRMVYFYSDQRAGANGIMMHVLEAEDLDAGAKINLPKTLEPQAATLKPVIEAIAKKLGKGGLVEVTPFQAAAGNKPIRVFSQIAVEGPGAYSGQVVDRDGIPVRGSERVSFIVTRGPGGANEQTAPGSGLRSIDADG